MALVPHKFSVVVSFMETSGNIVTREYFANDEVTDFAGLAVNWALMLPDVQAMTDAEISGYFYKVSYIEDALTLPTAAENNNQGLFTGKIDGDPTESAIVSVPAIKPTLMVSPTGKGFDVIDMGDAIVQDFTKHFTAGLLEDTWTISDGEQWSQGSVSGRRRNTKSNNS